MVRLLLSILFVGFACNSTKMNIDNIQARVEQNNCRITREELIFQIKTLEYQFDTLYSDIPASLLDDSLLVCPVSGRPYTIEGSGDDREIRCPTGHGGSSFQND